MVLSEACWSAEAWQMLHRNMTGWMMSSETACRKMIPLWLWLSKQPPWISSRQQRLRVGRAAYSVASKVILELLLGCGGWGVQSHAEALQACHCEISQSRNQVSHQVGTHKTMLAGWDWKRELILLLFITQKAMLWAQYVPLCARLANSEVSLCLRLPLCKAMGAELQFKKAPTPVPSQWCQSSCQVFSNNRSYI